MGVAGESPGSSADSAPATKYDAARGEARSRPVGAPGAGPPTRGSIALVATLGALSAFGPLCLDMYLPALTDLAPDLRSSDTAAQLTLSACIAGLALGQVLVGPLSDRIGRRIPLLAGVALFALVSAACAVTTSMTLLIVLRLVQGVGGAAGIVVGRAVVADRYTGRAAASYFAAMAAVNGLAPILAPLIGGQVLRVGTWRTVFWVLAVIGALLLVATFLVVQESLPVGRRRGGGLAETVTDIGIVLRDPVYLGYTLAGCFVAAAMFGYISGSPFLLQQGFGLSAAWFSAVFAANGVGIIIETWLGGRLLRWFAPVTLLAAGVAQAAAGAALLAVAIFAALALPWLLAAFFLMVSAVGLALTHASALAMDRRRDVAGAASAVLGLAQWSLAAAVAPLVGIGDRTAGHAIAVAAVASVLLAAAALRSALRAERRLTSGGQGRAHRDR